MSGGDTANTHKTVDLPTGSARIRTIKKIAPLFTSLVIGAMLTVPGPAAAQKNMDTRFEEIRSEAQRLMDEIKVPGIALSLIHI